MTDLTDSPNNKADNGNVAVADDDVAVPNIAPTAGPNHPRAKPNVKKVSKLTGNAPTPVPGRANQDKHWRNKTNIESKLGRNILNPPRQMNTAQAKVLHIAKVLVLVRWPPVRPWPVP